MRAHVPINFLTARGFFFVRYEKRNKIPSRKCWQRGKKLFWRSFVCKHSESTHFILFGSRNFDALSSKPLEFFKRSAIGN